MVTNFPHPIAHNEAIASAVPARDGVGVRVMVKVRQMMCGLHGHDNLLQFERDRMFLRCVSCGHETPGWEITEAPMTVRREVRPAMVHAHLVSERRIA